MQGSGDKRTYRQKQAGCYLGHGVRLEENCVAVDIVGSYMKMKYWASSGELAMPVTLTVVRQERLKAIRQGERAVGWGEREKIEGEDKRG